MTRSDALRNRARVVEAAAVVFAERGPEAGVEEVAVRAGVGKATVYRSFPTKEHLYAAVAIERLRWFEAEADASVAAGADAFDAFASLLRAAAEAQAEDRVLGGSLATAAASVPELVEARASAAAALGRVMARAQAAGAMRRDAGPDDVRVLFSGVCRVLGDAGETDAAVWRRHADLVVCAFRS